MFWLPLPHTFLSVDETLPGGHRLYLSLSQ
ncbi:hypothetical protein DNFV4_03360 [Nitrospira tepida]|uniref:Uncharacterized protein n=1 Tax=Nitrospira tepida TaxID=2973512 RepID=A0AA86N1P7_9BACT|nr:hypothetical protein DNFV4_03360 [Nitrospira tepida]